LARRESILSDSPRKTQVHGFSESIKVAKGVQGGDSNL
jgi:hypothetical protein